MSDERWEVWFSGHVQGVGFRYTARSIARAHDVQGYVRNLPDGRVHLVVEGERTEVTRFLDAVEHKMAHFIREAKKDKAVANGEFSGFGIRH